MADIKDWMALGHDDPAFEHAVKQAGATWPDLMAFPSLPEARALFKQMGTQAVPPVPAGVQQKDHEVSMRDGHTITCRSYGPSEKPATGSPLMVFFHGGGWCIGGLEFTDVWCRLLATELGVTSVSVDYRLAPEWKFPYAVEDSFDATKWAVEHAATWGADVSNGFFIGGESAGGNLAAVISHLWRDAKMTPALAGAHLLIPFLCHDSVVPAQHRADYGAWEQNRDAPVLGRAATEMFVRAYRSEDAAGFYADPRFSPLLWPTGHKGLPRTYFQICGKDPLRDEALIYERLLREEEGVATKVDVYPGKPHGFWGFLPQLDASKQFISDSVKGVKWLLEK